LEGSTSEKTEAATMSTISEPKNEPNVKLYAPKRKAFPLFCMYYFLIFFNAGVELYHHLKHSFNLMQGIMISVENGTTSPNSKKITSSTHSKSVSSSSGLSTTSKSETSSLVSIFYVFIGPILLVYNLTVNKKK
jgi:hypothetical protein